MTVKSSISLSDSQDRFARGLVESGKYASLSSVFQHGLDLLRQKTEAEELELAALLSRDTQSYELRRHPVLRGVAQRNGPGSAR